MKTVTPSFRGGTMLSSLCRRGASIANRSSLLGAARSLTGTPAAARDAPSPTAHDEDRLEGLTFAPGFGFTHGAITGIHTTLPAPPTLGKEDRAWNDSDVWASVLDPKRKIFCNRSLNMKSIRAIGFDMDYTLSQYIPSTFEQLAYDLARENLIRQGYPSDIRQLRFDHHYMVRGLSIDKRRGNVVKIDRHKYVKIAHHGFRPLSRDERLSTYNQREVRDSFEEPDYTLIDTMFSLSEAYLYMQLVELKDARPTDPFLSDKTYAQLYKDVRGAVDMCHRDGTLKRAVASDPARYIHEDTTLLPLLKMLRQAGYKLFLATNSLWDYTHVVMSYVLEGRTRVRTHDWLQHFDVVLTGCGKPVFFTERRPLFEVHLETAMLMNTDNGNPMSLVYDAPGTEPGGGSWSTTSSNTLGGESSPGSGTGSILEVIDERANGSAAASSSGGHAGGGAGGEGHRARVYQGGYYTDLHRMLGVQSGAQVLYVGDHVYGDILRSKKTLGWRTMLVVPELQGELIVNERTRWRMQDLRSMRQQRESLEDQMERCRWKLAHGGQGGVSDKMRREYEEALEALSAKRDELRRRHREDLKAHHEQYHSVWGAVTKTGYVNSFFSHQLERFACVYTSHVNNLLFYSPNKSYRGKIDRSPHEMDTQPYINTGGNWEATGSRDGGAW